MATSKAAAFHHDRRTLIALLVAVVLAPIAGVSTHVVRGVYGSAFVSSPTANADEPIKIIWTGASPPLDTTWRVVCLNAANTSDPRVDAPEWPRITALGLELPGSQTGFSLLEPLDGRWDLVEDIEEVIPGRGAVTLDFAVVAHVNPFGLSLRGPEDLLGIGPGQKAIRGSGLRFCVSGPFPDTLPIATTPPSSVPTTIERLLNGVVVRFHNVQPHGPSIDVGVWESNLRTVPLYPE